MIWDVFREEVSFFFLPRVIRGAEGGSWEFWLLPEQKEGLSVVWRVGFKGEPALLTGLDNTLNTIPRKRNVKEREGFWR